MTLIADIKNAILENKIKPIFNSKDLESCGISDPNNNISNYDKNNKGSKNKKVLISTWINGKKYYSFDERVFP